MIRRLLERLGLRKRRTYRDEILSNSPLGYWPLGFGADRSGNGNHMTWVPGDDA